MVDFCVCVFVCTCVFRILIVMKMHVAKPASEVSDRIGNPSTSSSNGNSAPVAPKGTVGASSSGTLSVSSIEAILQFSQGQFLGTLSQVANQYLFAKFIFWHLLITVV